MILVDEDAAARWLRTTFDHVPRETWERLTQFLDMLRAESARQNLVSASTIDTLHLRHVADSAQLLLHAPQQPSRWLDLGSGAGFPGLIVALLSSHQVALVESRKLRITFLQEAAATLGLGDQVQIVGAPAGRVPPAAFDVISARAFAPLPRLLDVAHRFSTATTSWLLPKGRGAQSELDQVADAWQGDFRLVPSLTDPDARIIIAQGVRRRAAGSRQRGAR